MKKIEDIESIKQISLGILETIDDYCKENGLQYSLACGTLIGAVRHSGFIPWDDDVDIYMKRDDYNRFVTDFPLVYKQFFSVVSLERSGLWNRPYAKAYDNRTLELENSKYNIAGIGLGIDIFPIDSAPDEEITWKNYERKRRFLRNVYMIKGLTWRKNRPLLKNIQVCIANTILYPFSYRKLALLLDSYSKMFNNQNTQFYAENCYGIPNERFPKSDFEKTISMSFEDAKLQVMSGYDDYLTRFYGDYMQLPPEEKQVTHHAFDAYWK